MSRIRYDVKVKYDENNNPVDILSADNKALNVVTTKTDPTSGVIRISAGGTEPLTDVLGDGVIPLVSISSPADAALISCVRASAVSYFNAAGVLATASVNTPVFEYDPVTHEFLGLRAEESRTNKALYSEDYSNAAWSKSAVTVNVSAVSAPDGVGTMQLLTETSTSATINETVAVTAGQVVAHSAFLKRGNHDWVRMAMADASNSSNIIVGWFNLATGRAGYVGPSPTGGATQVCTGYGSHIKDCGNGVYRCSVWGVITGATSIIFHTMSADKNRSTTRNGAGSTRYQWGHQIEATTGSDGASSYIKTTNAAVTRAADSLTVGVANVGAVAVSYRRQRHLSANYSSGYPVVFSLDDGTANNSVVLDGSYNTYAERLTVTSGGSAQPVIEVGPSAHAVNFKSCAEFSSSYLSVNGRFKEGAITVPAGLITLRLGNNVAGTRSLNGHIAAIYCYPELSYGNRKLASSVSQAIPVTTGATAETVALLSYLRDTDRALMNHANKTVRSVGDNADRITNLLTAAGYAADYPVIYGYSVSEWKASATSTVIDASINSSLIDQIKALFRLGRVITIHDSMPNFLTGGDSYDKANYCLRQCVPGGPLNAAMHAYLDGMCNLLNGLTIEGGKKIPVMLRLFRESRMGVYWWSNYDAAPDGDPYAREADIIAVYRDAVNYVRARCNNVLFVYCAGVPNGGSIPTDGMSESWYNAVYPGDDVIDIVTIDPYNDGANPFPGHVDVAWMTAAINANVALAKAGSKPWGLAEIGFKYSGRLWDATYASNATIDAAHGYSAPTSFWDGVVLPQLQKLNAKPCYVGWWGEDWTPKAGDATAASGVAFLRSSGVALASAVKRKSLYGF